MMQYRYVLTKENYEDYSAGRVIIATGGSTSFPVRLANEIFQRCLSFFEESQQLTVYDPCAGTGYLLTVLGFLHGDRIAKLMASDIDPNAIDVAQDNLNLLTVAGMQSRQLALQQLIDDFNKQSHYDALASAKTLSDRLPKREITLKTWQADALQASTEDNSVDLLICDVPYGDNTSWRSANDENPIYQMLEAQLPVLRSGGVIVIISDKKQKAVHPSYTQKQHETIGKRRFVILQKN